MHPALFTMLKGSNPCLALSINGVMLGVILPEAAGANANESALYFMTQTAEGRSLLVGLLKVNNALVGQIVKEMHVSQVKKITSSGANNIVLKISFYNKRW